MINSVPFKLKTPSYSLRFIGFKWWSKPMLLRAFAFSCLFHTNTIFTHNFSCISNVIKRKYVDWKSLERFSISISSRIFTCTFETKVVYSTALLKISTPLYIYCIFECTSYDGEFLLNITLLVYVEFNPRFHCRYRSIIRLFVGFFFPSKPRSCPNERHSLF